MVSSPTSHIILSEKDYCQITIDIFQGYTDEKFEGKYLWTAIIIDFKLWTKKDQEAINATTWMIIEQYCIPHSIWINHYKNKSTKSEMLMKQLVLATKYDIDFSN